MIEYRVGNVLEEKDINVILQQCNLYCTFGNGIAKVIKDTYPEAYEADCKTKKGDKSKLGTYTTAATQDGKIICNCYSQTGMGASDRNTSYNDILSIFKTIEEKIRKRNASGTTKELIIGIPYKYGSGIAGGSWRIVNAIIEEAFKKSPVKCVIVRLASEPEIDIS